MIRNLESFPWSDPIPSDGDHYRNMKPGPDFWEWWREDKLYLKSKGIKVVKGDDWEVQWWGRGEPISPDPRTVPPLLPIEDKLGEVALLPPQVPHVQWIVRNLRIWDTDIDPSSTGSGKTAMSLLVAHNLGLDPVVVCPKSVIGSWEKWASRTGQNLNATNYDQVIRGNWEFCKKTKRKRPAYLQFEWVDMQGKLLIFDEGHLLKGQETQTACLLGAAKRSGCKILVLSATLAEKLVDLKNLGYCMDLHNWANWREFLQRNNYFQPTMTRRIPTKRKSGGYYFREQEIYLDWKFRGSEAEEKEAMRKVGKSIWPRMGHKLTVEDMGAYMPENEIIPWSINISGVAGVYEAMKEQLSTLRQSKKQDSAKFQKKLKEYMDKGLDPRDLEPSKLTIMLRAQQEIELLKAPVAVQMAKNFEKQGYSVALFCRSRAALQAMHDHLGGEIIHGDVKGRQAICDGFQADEFHFICIQSASGGTGISLHDETEGTRPRISIIFPEFSARTIKQTLGRIHRVGGRSKVHQYILFDSESPYEIKACQAVQRKVGNMGAFDGSEEDFTIIDEGGLTSGLAL